MKRLIIVFFAFLKMLGAQNLYDDSIIREFRIEFSQPDWKTLLKNNIPTEEDIPATLIVEGARYDSVGVRYKGNSSLNIPNDKKPFNISMDTYKSDQTLWGYKTINLNNCFKDPTFVREKIAYEIASMYLPNAKTSFAKLIVNNENYGVYLNVQQLNKTFLRETFGSSDGNHFKCDPAGDLRWLGPDKLKYKTKYELKTNESADDWSDLINLIDILNNLPQQQFQTEIVKYLNVDRALWYIAFCNLLVNLDSYLGSGHNYYLYNNPADNRFHTIPWDLNEVLGTFSEQNMNIQQREQLSVFYRDNDPMRPLVMRLLGVSDFRERYISHFRTMYEETFTTGFWNPRITAYQNLIRTEVQADTKKLYSMQAFDQNVTSNISSGNTIIPGLISFINNRRNYLQTVPQLTRAKSKIVSITNPTAVSSKESVTITVIIQDCSSANLWYGLNGTPFSKIDLKKSNDTVFTTTILSQNPGSKIFYYVEAINENGARSYFPERAEHETFSYISMQQISDYPVVINELLASNVANLKDPQNQFDDWIELFNSSNDTIDLGGKYMSDDISNTTKWKFPTGTKINPGGYLIVWADEDGSDSPGFHANFKLSKNGESVFLFDSIINGNPLLDSTAFGVQSDDVAWGRIPNGTGKFVLLNTPTPLSINTLNVSVMIEDNLPQNFLLRQNYPNPFNPSTTIKFSIPNVKGAYNALQTTLKIYDMLGRDVATLVDEKKSPGIYEVKFDASGLTSGIYFYILQIDNPSTGSKHAFEQTKKMIFLK